MEGARGLSILWQGLSLRQRKELKMQIRYCIQVRADPNPQTGSEIREKAVPDYEIYI